jgi:hypothetical protein
MDFSYNDYLRFRVQPNYHYPQDFFNRLNINREVYLQYQNAYRRNNNGIQNSFQEIKKRIPDFQYHRLFISQYFALIHATNAFPVYKFFIPEILMHDWLGMVDWHKFHRDHSLHQPLTAHIVYRLLGVGNNQPFTINGVSILDIIVDNILSQNAKVNYLKEYLIGTNSSMTKFVQNNQRNRILWRNLFIETAINAALFHDFGYPWQYLTQLGRKLYSIESGGFDNQSNSRFINDNFRNRLLLAPLNGYRLQNQVDSLSWDRERTNIICKALNKTHGFPGALGFLSLNDQINAFPRQEINIFQRFAYDWASMAIMMHDLDKLYWNDSFTQVENPQLRLKLDQDPLSFILTLADQLQEFERAFSVFPPIQVNRNYVNIHYITPCEKTEIIENNGVVDIHYYFNNAQARRRKRNELNELHNKYYNNINGYFDIRSAGIHQVNLFVH